MFTCINLVVLHRLRLRAHHPAHMHRHIAMLSRSSSCRSWLSGACGFVQIVLSGCIDLVVLRCVRVDIILFTCISFVVLLTSCGTSHSSSSWFSGARGFVQIAILRLHRPCKRRNDALHCLGLCAHDHILVASPDLFVSHWRGGGGGGSGAGSNNRLPIIRGPGTRPSPGLVLHLWGLTTTRLAPEREIPTISPTVRAVGEGGGLQPVQHQQLHA